MRTRLLSASTLLAVASTFAPHAAFAQSVWVAPETQKVRPDDAPGSARAASLEAAKNEFEAFHVVVDGGGAGVAGVTVTASPLVGPAGAAITGGDVRVYREAFIDVQTPSNVAGKTGRWPDALIPAVDELVGETRSAFPVAVAAHEQQPVYVEYHVPASAPAGVYTGTVHVDGGGLAVDVPVSLTVHAIALPSTASLPTAFHFDWTDACALEYGGYAGCGGDAGVVRQLALYTRFALDHRVSIDAVYTGPQAAAIGWDWATWDATYGAFFDGAAPTRLAGAKLTTIRYAWDSADATKYGAWASHFRAKGWFDRTFDYTCDEPPAGCAWGALAGLASTVHAGDPQFRTLATTTIALSTENAVLSSIDVLAPIVNLLQPKGAASTRGDYDAWLAGDANRRVWTYQSCMSHGCNEVGGDDTVGWPSYMIDAPATLNRAMEWQAWRLRAEGELYYATTYAWTRGDAWQTQYQFGGNGDGTLFYPGTPSKIGGRTPIPIASLRLEMIRAGQEDYEYLTLLRDAGDPAMADAEATALAPSSTTFTVDPAAIDAARHRILARIEALRGIAPPSGMAQATPAGSDNAGSGASTSPAVDPSSGMTSASLATAATTAAGAGGCSIARAPRGERRPDLAPLVVAGVGLASLGTRARRRRAPRG